MDNTIIVIDPNTAVRAITAAALSQLGADIQALEDGSKALADIRLLKPQIVLCSDDITGENPFSLCQEIKEDPLLQGTKFVLLASG